MQCYVYVNCGVDPDQLMLLTPHMMKLLLVSTDIVKNMAFKKISANEQELLASVAECLNIVL
jgi:hypothetical protein